MFSRDKRLRQVTIEGICKMLFSIKVTRDFKFNEKQTIANDDLEGSEQETDESLKEGIITIVSHLIIQWFDKKYNCQKSLVRQALSMFFHHFILFSVQRCELML